MNLQRMLIGTLAALAIAGAAAAPAAYRCEPGAEGRWCVVKEAAAEAASSWAKTVPSLYGEDGYRN